MSIITDKIDQLLKRNGMLKKDFYAAVGISPAAYSQWKLGQSQPTLGKLQRAADVLGVDLSDIISAKNTTTRSSAPLLEMKEAIIPKDDGLMKELSELDEFIQLYLSAPSWIQEQARSLLEAGARSVGNLPDTDTKDE